MMDCPLCSDPPVCRLQFPDGTVPGNAREAAEGWKKWADEFEQRALKWERLHDQRTEELKAAQARAEPPRELRPRPTIEELDAILNSEDDTEICVLPDGSIEAKKKDWRIGLSCKVKMRDHPLYYEGHGKIIGVEPSGTGGIVDRDGVLRIELNGKVFLAPADDWVTA